MQPIWEIVDVIAGALISAFVIAIYRRASRNDLFRRDSSDGRDPVRQQE